jgi:hypothetical protein
MQYRGAVRAYIEENNYRRAPGVYLAVTVQSGAIIDLRVLDQTGPPELCAFTVNWVRRTWVPQSEVHTELSICRYTTSTAAFGSVRKSTPKKSRSLAPTPFRNPQSAFRNPHFFLLVPQCFDRIERCCLVRRIETEHNTDY